MFPELSIERVFRRELDSLPLPDEEAWVPTRQTRPSRIVAASLAGAALLLVLISVGLIREASGSGILSQGAASTPRATCAPPAFGANGRCQTLLPNLVRNEAFGYNLTIPGNWREVRMPAGTDPYVIGRPNASPSLTAPFLLDRHVFTARPAQEWAG